jgi:hypothetical protein
MSRPPNLRAEMSKAVRLLTAPFRVLPSFVIPGAPKCGTSTLYDWLVAHPRVRRGMRKEPTNFVHYPGSRFRSAMNYPFAAEKLLTGDFIVGDGSVEYFAHPEAPVNVRAVIPEAKLVFLFRDPVARAWSDYEMFRRSGMERESFDSRVTATVEWVRDSAMRSLVESASRNAFNPVRYVWCGVYHEHVLRWLQLFSREQCLFLVSEEFFAKPRETAERVFRHLGLPAVDVVAPGVAREGGYVERMSAETEAVLRGFFEPHNRRLAELLGRELPWG